MANEANEHADLLKLLRKVDTLSKELTAYFRQYPSDKVSINTVRKNASSRLAETRRALMSLERVQQVQESNVRFVVRNEDGTLTAMSSNELLKIIGQNADELDDIMKGGVLR